MSGARIYKVLFQCRSGACFQRGQATYSTNSSSRCRLEYILLLLALWVFSSTDSSIAMLGWFQWHRSVSFHEWTQYEHDDYDSWLDGVVAHVRDHPQTIHPSIEELRSLVNSSTRLTQLVQGMYDELRLRSLPRDRKFPFLTNIRDHEHMFQVLNYLLTVPVLWSSYRYLVSWLGCPILCLFWRPLHTTCGFAFFQDREVNAVFKKILDVWGRYLRSSESAWCLDNDPQCWFSPEALAHLIADANLGDNDQLRNFEDIYICDPSKPRYGFISWDDFFTRHFRDRIRPLAGEQDDSVIVHACEAAPDRIQGHVRSSDKFWAKGHPYSLADMLDHDELTTNFKNGTVYQAYLSALSYRRWHSPVSGIIVKATLIPGSYFSAPPYAGFDPRHNSDTEQDLVWSNAYQSAVSTRALIFIQSDNPDIGLMAVLFIGLCEVSTCEIGVEPGQIVRKGDEIGLFHCGGSTYCMIFREGVKLVGLPSLDEVSGNLPVRSCLARVESSRKVHTEKM